MPAGALRIGLQYIYLDAVRRPCVRVSLRVEPVAWLYTYCEPVLRLVAFPLREHYYTTSVKALYLAVVSHGATRPHAGSGPAS
jgi:hypothetical protein